MFCRIALAWLSNNCLFHHRLIISSCLPAKKRILLRVDIKTHSRVSRPPFTQKKNLCGSFKHFLCVGPGKISNLTNMFQMPFLPGGEPPTSCNRNGYGDACWQWSFPLSFFFLNQEKLDDVGYFDVSNIQWNIPTVGNDSSALPFLFPNSQSFQLISVLQLICSQQRTLNLKLHSFP